MSEKRILVAYGKHGHEMGYRGSLPWEGALPADMKHVVAATKDATLIMGRATFDSIGKPLAGRETIVVTSSPLEVESVIAVKSLASAFESSTRGNVILFGGAGIYKEALYHPEVTTIDATEIDGHFPADTFFPYFGPEWQEVSRDHHEPDEKNHYPYDFVLYKKTI